MFITNCYTENLYLTTVVHDWGYAGVEAVFHHCVGMFGSSVGTHPVWAANTEHNALGLQELQLGTAEAWQVPGEHSLDCVADNECLWQLGTFIMKFHEMCH